MVAGNLKVKVLRLEDFSLKEGGLKGLQVFVRLSVGKQFAQTVPVPAETGIFDEVLVLYDDKFGVLMLMDVFCSELANAEGKQNLLIEIVKDIEQKVLATAKKSLGAYLVGKVGDEEINLEHAAGVIVLNAEFEAKDGKGKKSTPATSAAPVATTTTSKNDAHASIPRTLSTAVDKSSIWYLHPSFYYTKTKEVYAYATSFTPIAFVAHYGESTLEYFLKRFAPKTSSLTEVDKSLVPALSTADTKVDEKVAYLLKTITDGQDYLLKTKDGAVNKVSETVSATKSTVVSTVTGAQNKVSEVTSSAVETAYSLSNSTYLTLASATNQILAYVPLINKKATA
ncbi:Aste57867_23265 [Aphanomyces stellatus]|uniref:Aste57867_23265 protein n=1 Tax=Aphanomyces stellatus TaxID=120398 RepID=A0A485LMP2_9STRA|nr:hypothetical protein As57867_023194 [Aphanomyces stellatus]VFT99910.1 Aste57867_23265 [Aphanomyces stellatus]